MALNRAVEINHGRRLPGTPPSATGLAQPQTLRASPPRQDQKQADQGRRDSSRIHAIKGIEQFANLLGGTLGHDPTLANQLRRINLGRMRHL